MAAGQVRPASGHKSWHESERVAGNLVTECQLLVSDEE